MSRWRTTLAATIILSTTFGCLCGPGGGCGGCAPLPDDRDADGLSNSAEELAGTDPENPDTDTGGGACEVLWVDEAAIVD